MSGRGDDRISMYGEDDDKKAMGEKRRLVMGEVQEIEQAREEIVPEPRGRVLSEAINIINGERQDVYGSPESSYSLIAEYWRTYLRHKKNLEITSSDVAMMMTLFKVAREANQHKRDNIVDAAGYLGIYADMQERK